MENVHINTAQNVQINYTLAGLGDRMIAYIIDAIIMYSVVIVMLLVLINIAPVDSQPILYAVLGVPIMFYHLIFEVFMNGQTPGKKTQDIKVVKLDGSKPTLGSYLLRWILRPVDFLLSGSVAIIAIVVGKHSQRIGDLAAGTTVIKIKNQKNFLQNEVVTQLPDDYQPRYPEAIQLSGQHAILIKEAIDVQLHERNGLPAASLSIKIKTRLKIDSDQPDIQFLTTILKDYNYLSSKQTVF